MPHVPNSLNVEPAVSTGQDRTDVNSNEQTGDRSSRFNYNQNFNFNDIYANVSEEQIEEIRQTFHVNMVSESMDNLSSRSSSSCAINNRDNSNQNNQNCNQLNNTNIVCGIVVVDDRLAYNQLNNTLTQPLLKNCVVLGSVILSKSSYTCEELRRCLQTQLSTVWTDPNQKFVFLTKEGWPLTRSQENKVNAFSIIGANNVIAIRKTFDKPRFGLINANNDSFGFVFAEYLLTLRQLRDVVDDHFKELGLKHPKPEYIFIERNGWPVATNQELFLSVLDVVSNQTICLAMGSLRSIAPPVTQYPSPLPIKPAEDRETKRESSLYAVPALKFKPTTDEISINNTARTLDLTQTDSVLPSTTPSTRADARGKSRRTGFSVVSMRKTVRKKEKVVSVKSTGKNGKAIMVSYARQEAAQHALNLKDQLVQRGFSVYLDVHEIQTGSDWMDSLNDAVRGCEVFVPLVTPMYGKTQWTNREVKLADLLHKYIIPINFLETWPPECLAIQFATTQYIPWRPPNSEHESPIDKTAPDIKNWSETHLMSVSNQIAIHIKENMKSLSAPPKPVMPALIEADGPKDNETEAAKPLIVISAHPQDKPTVAEIKALLEGEYQVWCTTDLPDGGLLEEDLMVKNSPPFTPTALPTIDETKEIDTMSSNEPFNERYKDIARQIIEKNKKSKQQQRPKSLPTMADNVVPEPKKPLLTRVTSQTSETSHLSSLPADKIDRLKAFQEQIISAGVVIIIASEAYYKSTTSQQHVYYCEQRKKTLFVRYDQCSSPPWFQMLRFQESDTLSIKNPNFEELLKSRVKRILDPMTKAPEDDLHESKMNYLVSFMKKNLPLLETCVYVVGSTKLQDTRSEEICRAIGTELAKVKNVNVVTSGFYGAGDLVALSFQEARHEVCQIQSQIPNTPNPNSFESSVVHIVPVRDSEDISNKCRQSADGSFDKVPYGKTVFLGESVKERESAVARLLDTCILIEGGPGAAHEIEEFIWNDHFVIPIISSGGAASGLYGVPSKIFDCPHGVSESDWQVLSTRDASPVEVAKAVVKIVVSVKEAIASHALSKLHAPLKAKAKLMRKQSQAKKRLADRRKVNIVAANAVGPSEDNDDPNSPEKILPIIETTRQLMENANIGSNNSKWKRMGRMLKMSSKRC